MEYAGGRRAAHRVLRGPAQYLGKNLGTGVDTNEASRENYHVPLNCRLGPGPGQDTSSCGRSGRQLRPRPQRNSRCPAPGACGTACCDSTCLKKVCVPGVGVKNVEKRVYGEACEDICVPKCSLLSLLVPQSRRLRQLADASCPQCEKCIYQRKYLVVKIRQEQQTYNRCSVELQPAEPKESHGFFCRKDCGTGGACPRRPSASRRPFSQRRCLHRLRFRQRKVCRPQEKSEKVILVATGVGSGRPPRASALRFTTVKI